MVGRANLKIGLFFLLISIFFTIFMVPTVSDEWRKASIADVEFFTVGPRFFPYLSAGIMGLLSILLIIESITKIRAGDRERHEPITTDQLKPVLAFILIGVVYIAVLPFLGVILATPLCLVVYFLYFELRNWFWIIGLSVSMTVIVYLCFAKLMMVPLPMGFFE